VNGGGPAVCGVQQGGAGVLGDVLDAVLGAPVLMMGVDAAEGQGLIG